VRGSIDAAFSAAERRHLAAPQFRRRRARHFDTKTKRFEPRAFCPGYSGARLEPPLRLGSSTIVPPPGAAPKRLANPVTEMATSGEGTLRSDAQSRRKRELPCYRCRTMRLVRRLRRIVENILGFLGLLMTVGGALGFFSILGWGNWTLYKLTLLLGAVLTFGIFFAGVALMIYVIGKHED
jgi:hypothetical protein